MSKKRGNRKNDPDDDFDDSASKVSSIAESDLASNSSKSKKKGKGKGKRNDSDDELTVPLPATKKNEKVNKGKSLD